MRSNIIEVAGGTFVVTAISYATGIAYYNAFFRNLNGNPDLFSVSLERILFEGGRQLLAIAFKPTLAIIALTLSATILNLILTKLGINFFDNLSLKIKNSTIWASIEKFSWAYLFLAMSIVTSFAFGSGNEAGAKYARTTSCTSSTVNTEKGNISGCLIYKTDSEIWLLTTQKNQKILLNIPNDKYLSIEIH